MSGALSPIKARPGELLAVASAAELGGDRQRIKLFPYGTWFGRDGRGPYTLEDRAHADQVIATTRALMGSTDIAFDYDHAMVPGMAPANGQAIASGWVSPADLFADDDGVWATNVKWTAAAAERLDAKEYRYVSPFFGFEKGNGRITRLINVALVNRPNFELQAVAQELLNQENDVKDLTTIASALGLGADTTADAIVASIGGLKASVAAASAALGLKGDAKAEDFAAAAEQLKTAAPDPAKFVPIEGFNDIKARLAVIDEERAAAAVDQAIAAQKLSPAMRDWGLNLYRKDETAFAQFVASAPKVIGAAPTQERKADALDGEELAVAQMLGIPGDKMLESSREFHRGARKELN